jgi:hypothetical protein
MTKYVQQMKSENAPPSEAVSQATGPATKSHKWLSSLRNLMSRPTATASSTAPTRNQSTASPPAASAKRQTRYFIGIFIYFILGEFLGIGESAIFARLPKADNPTLAVLPLLGPLQISAVVFALTLILLLVAMYKIDLLPRRLNQAAGARAAKSSAKNAVTKSGKNRSADPPKPTHSGPVSGPHDEAYERVRAALRQQRRRERRRR